MSKDITEESERDSILINSKKKAAKDNISKEVKKILKVSQDEDYDNEPVLTLLLEILQQLQDIAKK